MAGKARKPQRGASQRGAAQRGASGRSSARGTTPGNAKNRQPPRRREDAAEAVRQPAESFTLGAIPGATPGKWIDAWHERMPQTRLELVPLTVAGQREAVRTGAVDAALVRLPLDREGLHTIALYDEVPVVIASADSSLTAADELSPEDLADEVLIRAADDALNASVAGTREPSFPAPATTADAVEIVAAGVGILIVPMSLARLHKRKDVEYRPLIGGPTSTVALAWVANRTTPEVEAFVGIVRGRTANSSRG